MALGYLFIAFIGMCILAVVGTILLFAVKKEKLIEVILILMTVFSLVIAHISATAQPINFIGSRIAAWVIGLIAVAGTGIWFITKRNLIVSQLLAAGSVIAGIYFLYFK